MAKDKKHKNKPTKAESEPETSTEAEEMPDFGEIFAAWQFPEFAKHQRGAWWYIISIAITIGLLIFCWFTRNIMFAIIIVLALIIYLSLERKEPIEVGIAITEDGILLNDKLIDYKSLDNFYIIYYPPRVKNLYLQPKNILRQLIIVPLEDQDPVFIRQALLQYLTEDTAKENLPPHEAISRLLKL